MHAVAQILDFFTGYLRFGVYTETIRAKDCCAQNSEEDKQFLIREFSMAEEDLSEEDNEHIYVPSVTVATKSVKILQKFRLY